MIATLQQQVNTMLLQQQGSRVEVTRPQIFSGKMEEVSTFINTARIYIRIKMMEEAVTTQVAWVLSYVQGGVAEVWKDNLLDELAKGEWQERAVRLDRNQRQSRVEERMLGRNAAHPGGNAQPRGGSYGERGGQIMQRWGDNRGGNMFNRGGYQPGPRRDPNAMDVDRGTGEDRKCYHCRKFGHMARNCWDKNKARVVETPQGSVKENGGQ